MDHETTENGMSSLYKRLDENEIRLLSVISHDGVTAELDLQTYSRDQAPEYDAVSYTWGENLDTTSISCNRHPLQIRTNLFKALPYIHGSRPGPQRPLWIDALCLNQGDDAEKAIQVPFMGVTYKQATRTLIWLGEAAEDSDLALDNISDLTQRMLDVDPDQCKKAHVEDKNLQRAGLPDEQDPVWRSLQAIQLRPWFYRLWTLQEIVLAAEAIMLCGTRNMPWDALEMLQKAAGNARLLGLLMPVELVLSGKAEKFELHIMIIRSCGIFRSWLRNHESIPLDSAVLSTSNRHYTEPVDRIWAILALLGTRDQELISKASLINYGSDARREYHQTYLGIMRIYIEQVPIVGLALIEDGLSYVHNPQLPHWCPDWHLDRTVKPISRMARQDLEEPIPQAGVPKIFQDSSTSAVHFSVQLRPTMLLDASLTLRVPGYTLDTTETMTKTTGLFWATYIHESRKLDIDRVMKSCNWLRQCLNIVKVTRNPHESTGIHQQTGHTPSIPSEHIFEPVEEAYITMQKHIQQLGDLLYFNDNELINHSVWVQIWCSGRKFFRTQTGRFGIGPQDLEEGDLVCALYAGRPLFVLRPVESQGELKQRYRIVGDAYVPGLMQGEGFRGKKLEDMQEFCLI